MRALTRVLIMAGLLGSIAPEGVGLLRMAADMPKAQAKEAKRPQVGSKEYERDMMELQKLKGDAQYGIAVPAFRKRYLELQEKYNLNQDGYTYQQIIDMMKGGQKPAQDAPEK